LGRYAGRGAGRPNCQWQQHGPSRIGVTPDNEGAVRDWDWIVSGARERRRACRDHDWLCKPPCRGQRHPPPLCRGAGDAPLVLLPSRPQAWWEFSPVHALHVRSRALITGIRQSRLLDALS
jgi:hypothetical protein